ERVRASFEETGPKVSINEHSLDIFKVCRVRRIGEQQHHSGPSVAFKHRSTGSFQVVQAVENSQQLVHQEAFFGRVISIPLKQVDTSRTVHVCRLKKYKILETLVRKCRQHPFCEVPVWVNYADPMTRLDVLEDQTQ